jgi:hypothetical protein
MFELGIVTETPVLTQAFSAVGGSKCDGLGNAYFKVPGYGRSETYILRISRDGRDVKRIPLPSDLSKSELSAFYAEPGGTLYELITSMGSPLTYTYTLVEISSSGNEVRRTALQVAEPFGPSEFAVLPDGKVMVRGTKFLPDEPAPKGKTPVDNAFLYMAWFDANGQLLQDNGSSPKGRDLFDTSTHTDFAAITPGPPGTFLTVSDNSLNTYDAKGTLVHSNPIAKPEKDAIASGIQYLDGQAEILFEVPIQVHVSPSGPEDGPHPSAPDPDTHKPWEGTALYQVWLFADPEVGTMHGFYKLPNFPGSGDCYLGNWNLLYTTVKATGPIFVEAHPK